MIRRFGALCFVLLSSLPLFGVDDVTLVEYQKENYFRHPMLEEEDRLRGRTFRFSPGLEIISSVRDMELRISGEKIGRTPWESDALKPGTYTIRLEKPGFQTIEFRVTLRNRMRTVLVVEARQSSGSLVLKGLPPDPLIRLDQQSVLPDELNPTAGVHRLRVDSFGWESVEDEIVIRPGEVLEWIYEGKREEFTLDIRRFHPRNLPAGDRRGLIIDWSASAPGAGRWQLLNADGEEVYSEAMEYSSGEGRVAWSGNDAAFPLVDGRYTIRFEGEGIEAGSGSSSTARSLKIDTRFSRESQSGTTLLPGLIYAPGAQMLPPGLWQVSTGTGYRSGGGVPVSLMFRMSPVERWELTAGLALTPRQPFEDTSLGFSLSGSWRVNRLAGPLMANICFTLFYDGVLNSFGRIALRDDQLHLPGIQMTIPLEYRFGRIGLTLSPAIHMSLIEDRSSEWYFGNDFQAAGSLALGAFFQGETIVVGFSTALRSPDFSGVLYDWSLWTGADLRIMLPGRASYLGISGGLQLLNSPVSGSATIEFGLIG